MRWYGASSCWRVIAALSYLTPGMHDRSQTPYETFIETQPKETCTSIASAQQYHALTQCDVGGQLGRSEEQRGGFDELLQRGIVHVQRPAHWRPTAAS